MKFGKVDDPGNIDFTLPPDHPDTKAVLTETDNGEFEMYVGCAKWNRKDLKNFYPRGTKDELTYYSRQFNSIELNATFYGRFSTKVVENWYAKTPDHFRFAPKIIQRISHFKRLKDTSEEVEGYINQMSHLKHKLSTIFLQMHPTFSPKSYNDLMAFIREWPEEFSLAVELRHPDWYNGNTDMEPLYKLMEEKDVSHIITDAAGRRDMLHMRLTNSIAFVRFTGANFDGDYKRLDEWIKRLKSWKQQGINRVLFFVHQNLELSSPMLAKYFIKKVNNELDLDLGIPGENMLF
ncbi:DUF72 domain-containing protein [Membranihabitans maritimus]|uniref:DUF72 domain-containing protein n=1 Tax=Membranihabitans maritimus TaxID=2904244 RepID=UPI001F477FB5|nr:DUF72 domain-containing protein [Membranihabitans maritimus]